jgi:1-acyl-sn-glycerol-3-phosphate acyltransferase/nucleoside-diphosphate-sugar epimerase
MLKQPMIRTVVIGPPWLRSFVAECGPATFGVDLVSMPSPTGTPTSSSNSSGLAAWLRAERIDVVVHADGLSGASEISAGLVFDACARASVPAVVVVSSAAAYGASYHNPGLMNETRAIRASRIDASARAWRGLELTAINRLHGSPTVLTILRPVATISPHASDCFSRLLRSRIAVTPAGFDPTIQLLAPRDLARAVCLAMAHRTAGIFNVAPDEPVTLREALRLARRRRLPVPAIAYRAAEYVARRGDRGNRSLELDYLRHPWTVSSARIERALGYRASRTSAQAVLEFAARSDATAARSDANHLAERHVDPFGVDERYIARYGAVFRFLERRYWRIETDGLHHLPRAGRAVIVGMHRGFMPLDGVMTLHLVVQHTGRVPRFLIHPGVGLRFPFLSNFMRKLGGIVACHENAAYVLERDQILGVYPEGIRGAFTMYRDAYRIGPSWRDDFVRMALRHRAPIVPFVTVGSAEIFPILGRIEWRWWKRQTEWPFFPLTPTFPLVPLPLPSKWHTQFLEPLHVEREFPPDAADDADLVARISDDVKHRIEHAAHAMRRRRPSIFFGSVFSARSVLEERRT